MATQTSILERRTDKLDVRVSPTVKAKLQAAASYTHRSLSDFVLDSALSRADELLADRRVFSLNAEAWTAFQDALDAPAKVLPRMHKLLVEPSVFDLAPKRDAAVESFVPTNFESLEALREAGYEGFRKVKELQASDCREVPTQPGVYLVLRPDSTEPKFLAENPGGHFKGKDPTVPVELLEGKWVSGAAVLYIGLSAASLRGRLRTRMKFSQGKPVGAWGGRFLWQIASSNDLILCWKTTPKIPPAIVEDQLLHQFRSSYGKLPFANHKVSVIVSR